MDFLWTKEITPPTFPKLTGDTNTEVLIIGGGMAGILIAKLLTDEGVDCLLVEGKTIGKGITKGTTAVLTAQHDTLYQDFIKSFGKEGAKQYLDANCQAVEQFRSFAQEYPCDFEETPSLMYSLNDKRKIEQEHEALKSLGFTTEMVTETPLPFPIAAGLKFPNMAQFHPLKFLYAIAKDLNIRENTYVEDILDDIVVTDSGNIQAKKIIVATHFPFINTKGMYFMKLYQRRSFVIALENAPKFDCTMEELADNGIYLRNYKDLLLIGGGDHRTGKKGEGFEGPRHFAKKYFPAAKEKYAWANQDCVTLDGVPYIGEYSRHSSNIYVATGFNLWGMTSSMIGAKILTAMILDKKLDYAPIFTPNRSMLRKQFFANAFTSMVDFATPTTKRCSHLGCALKWNPQERTWDCPCHGSRFNSKGEIIDNPAMRDSHVE